MTVSRLRVAKSETRELADRDRVWRARPMSEPEWKMGNATFLTAFIAIAAALAVVALVLR
jgi:hypothetical protein